MPIEPDPRSSPIRAVLCLWATTLAVALLVVLRGCAERGPLAVVRVELPTLTFQER